MIVQPLNFLDSENTAGMKEEGSNPVVCSLISDYTLDEMVTLSIYLLIIKHVSPSQEPEPQTQDSEDSKDSKTRIKKPRSISPLVCSYKHYWNVGGRVKSSSMFFVQIFIFIDLPAVEKKFFLMKT